MKLKKLTAALFILLIGATKAWAANDCQEPFYNKFIHKTFFYGKIDKSGIFCLNRDLYAPKVYRWLEGAEEDLGSPLLLIKSSHVALDLQGHEINEQWKGAGSAVLAYGDDQNGSPNSDVSIRNGVIINRTGSGFISSRWGYDADWPLLYKYAGYSEDKRSKKFPDPMAKYFTKEDFEIGQKNKPRDGLHNHR